MFRAYSVLVFLAVAFSGCSVHPIPDDVSPIPTEEIVWSARCETKKAVYDRIREALDHLGLVDMNPETVLEPSNLLRVSRLDETLAAKFQAYGASAIAYTFDFRITEMNDAEAALGFRLPTLRGNYDLGIGGKLNKKRYGQREFSSVETFSGLAKLNCDGFTIRSKNILYPITGSIGLYKAMNTFISLSEIGGGKGNFTDTLTFTTKVAGGLTPKLALNPVHKRFRVVSLDAKLDSEREDVHKMTVSFAFPEIDLRPGQHDNFGTSTGMASASNLRLLSQDAVRRAVENLCVARARDRENEFATLRQIPPETYCRQGPQEL